MIKKLCHLCLILVLVTVCILVKSCKQDKISFEWRRVDPDSSNCHPRDLYFFNPDTGLVFGQRDTAQDYTMITTNGGKSWNYNEYPSNYPELSGIFHIYAVNTSLIYGYSRNMLLVSHDLCKTWSIVDSIIPAKPRSFKMLDDKIGFLGGIDGYIYKTVDGGKTWAYKYGNTQGGVVNSLFSFNEIIYASLIVSSDFGGLIIKSDDYGENWYEVLRSYRPLRQIGFLDKNFGMAIFFENFLLTTCDGGQSWQSEECNIISNDQIAYIQIIDKQEAYLATDNNIISTLDGGRNWNFSFTSYGSVFSGFQMVSKNCGYAIDVINGYIFKFGE